MIKIAKITIFLLLSFSNFLLAQQSGAKRIGMIKHDKLIGGNTSLTRLIGDVTLEHNGTYMDCDSAYLYSTEGKFVAYGNVVVTSQKGTIVKGDSIAYNSHTNMAKVRGKIAYLIDSTATLRTTAIDFDTEKEIGFFEFEGTIKDSSQVIESKQGYYYSHQKNFVFIDQVKVLTPEYTIISDSLVYNTETKIFDFYSHTHIWGDKGYLYCNSGWYNSETDKLFFTKDSYILSESQEIIADTIYYENTTGNGKLYSNIQIIDTTQKLIALADLALFNLKTEDFELHKNPSIVIYSDDADSVFIKADTIISIVKPIPKPKILESTNDDDTLINIPKLEGILENTTNDTIPIISNKLEGIFESMVDSSGIVQNENSIQIELDTIEIEADSVNISTNILDTIDINTKQNLNIITEEETTEKVETKTDSTYRQIFAIKNVLSYNNDMQSSCDSMYFNTLDSISKMFYSPIVWNRAEAQITSDSVYTFSANGEIDRSEFYNNAFIIMPEDKTDYSKFHNQIKGRNIIFYFKNKDLYKMDVLGNVQSIFYSLSDRIANFAEAANFTVLFENKKVRRATYKTNPDSKMYPLNQVTVESSKLDNFVWHGDKRPRSKEDITTRVIREHRVEDYQKLTMPEFIITDRFNKLEEKQN